MMEEWQIKLYLLVVTVLHDLDEKEEELITELLIHASEDSDKEDERIQLGGSTMDDDFSIRIARVVLPNSPMIIL